MSDTYRTLTVVLDRDYHEDTMKDIMRAIAMTKGVTSVHPPDAVTGQDIVNRGVARTKFIASLFDILHAALEDEEKWEQIQRIADTPAK